MKFASKVAKIVSPCGDFRISMKFASKAVKIVSPCGDFELYKVL